MGFLDFLFRSKVELPKQDPIWIQEESPLINYSNKGVTFSKSCPKDKPWMAYLALTKGSKGNVKTIQFHIGYFKTKEEAQQARWEFIENLK